MPAHMIDSIFFRDLYGSDRMRAIFDDIALLQRWLDVEVALAGAQAELGFIPQYAADEIALRADAEKLDVARIKSLIDQTIHPIVPVIRVLADACTGDAGEYVHSGATTQDIMDTANVLQLKRAVELIEERLNALVAVLTLLARGHRDTVMAGRTHGQQALPITFGFKLAVLLAEVDRHRERLTQIKPRLLVGQFAGAVGTLASLPQNGLEIQERMMSHLGLGVPLIAWHTARDNFVEFTALLGLIAATTGKIAHEIITLQRTEVAEVEEPFNDGKVGSSTMPHKRNPMLCEAVVALARLVAGETTAGLHGMIQEHERDMGAWQMEWVYLPEACIMTDGALALTIRVLEGLHVYPDRMYANLFLLDGMMMSEAVMLALGEKVGRQTAHDIVYICAMEATENRQPFRDVLSRHPIVMQHLTVEGIEQMLDPAHYTGWSRHFVDRVTAQVDRSVPA